jgi:hypothetical protein
MEARLCPNWSAYLPPTARDPCRVLLLLLLLLLRLLLRLLLPRPSPLLLLFLLLLLILLLDGTDARASPALPALLKKTASTWRKLLSGVYAAN